MVESNSEITRKVTDWMIKVFRISGLWPSRNQSTFYWIYGILLLSTASMLSTLTMLIQLFGFTKREDLTENSYMALTELALSVKIINFYFRVRSMQSHVDIINEFEIQTDAERSHFIKRIKFIFILLIMDFALVNTAHTSVLISVFAGSERTIGFPAWHPIDWENSTTNYALVLIYQIYAMGITSNVQVVIQQFPSLMFCMVSKQMEILSMRLRSLGHKKNYGNEECRVIKTSGDELENDELREEVSEVSKYLVDCIETHHKILEFANNLQRDFSIPFFVQICMSGLVICGLANEAAATHDPAKQISFATILLAMLFQMFFPCYFGTQIIVSSSKLSSDMFQSNWICFAKKQKSMVSMFIESTKESTFILVGNLLALSLQTYSAIINVAYRLLAVVKNV